tara:strand:+ start:3185 stop:3418 length:234 start_codon:yes stop_codon:yes gene_type:complete
MARIPIITLIDSMIDLALRFTSLGLEKRYFIPLIKGRNIHMNPNTIANIAPIIKNFFETNNRIPIIRKNRYIQLVIK